MKRVNDIFYSLQGEGRNTGRAATFVRFAGCNLKCSFCDTDFASFREMSNEEIVAKLLNYPTRFVVLTGGEPSLQVDEELINLLHKHDFYIAIETNGTHKLVDGIDWTTCSPKGKSAISSCDELKCIYDGTTPPDDHGIEARYYYLQPCDTGNEQQNKEIVANCIEYIKQHPKWRLSLQTHKLVGFK